MTGPDDVDRPLRAWLPAGTTIRPEECGFELPDGRYLRLYEDGLREERPNGLPAVREQDRYLQQILAHRIRMSGNPHSGGYGAGTEYRTTFTFDVVLPEDLADVWDADLVDVCHRIHMAVVEQELDLDLEGQRAPAEGSDGTRQAVTIDLSAAFLT